MKFYENGEYRATKDWPYSVSAGCVVYRINEKLTEVLLLLRKAGDFPFLRDGGIDTYHLPKGHMAINETLLQAATRETEEEAAVKVEIRTYLGSTHHIYEDDLRRDKSIHYFTGEWVSDLESMDDEHSNRVWVDIDQAEKLLGSPNPKQEDEIIRRLKKFLEVK